MTHPSRARKPWELGEDETLTSFRNWKDVMYHNLTLEPNWAYFLPPEGKHSTWLTCTKATPKRGLPDDGNNVAQADRKSAVWKNTQLELMLRYITGYAPVLSSNRIVKQSTSFDQIIEELREYYCFGSSGAQFLDLASIRKLPTETNQHLYQRLYDFFANNMLTLDCGIEHQGVKYDEEMTPTLENTIVLLWLQLINPNLPAFVKQRYGDKLRNKTIASLKSEISSSLDGFLEEMKSLEGLEEAKVQLGVVQRAFVPKSSFPPKKVSKSCTLCKAAGRSSADTHFISECKFLPENDRRAIARSRVVDPVEEEPVVCIEKELDYLFDTPKSCRVEVFQSPTLHVFYGPHPIRLTIDTGATSTMIRSAFAKKIGLPISKATQSVRQADGRSPMTVVGEVHCEVTRGNYTFTLEGLVVNELENDVLAGMTFMKKNDISSRPAKDQLVIKGTEVVYYGPECHNGGATARRVEAHLCRTTTPESIMPGEYVEFPTPKDILDGSWALEPRYDCHVNSSVKDGEVWPAPQEIKAVDGTIRVVNTREEPIYLKKNQHVCQIWPMTYFDSNSSLPMSTDTEKLFLKARSASTTQPFSDAVQVNPDNALSESEARKFKDLLVKHDAVFDPALTKYNGASGNIEATVNMGPTLPPQRKGRVPQYNNSKLVELQTKFDDLERAGVFAKPEDVGVTVEYLNVSFLVKKPSGGTRLVTNFGEVGTYSKPQPSLMPNVDKVLRDIASWKFIVITDLLQSFYQIPLAHSSMKYCGVATPFKGVRVYTRSAMGMPGSETSLEELMSRVLGDLIMEGRVAKIADDLYCGGVTVQEAFENLERVLEALEKNNLHLSAHKTIICPVTAVILGWIWSNGTLKASPHRLSSLSSVDPPETVQSLRSFIGAYKVLSRVLPTYAHYLDPLDQLTAGRDSKEKIVWTDVLLQNLKDAQEALKNAKTITLPTASDTLWIVTDGAVKSRGLGATLYVRRSNGKLYLAGFFNAKLKKHQITWLPCEVEALCIASAVKHFSPYIIQSSATTQVLTDSRPCVQSYAKLNRGEFSNSARVSTYLSTVSRYQVHVSHIAGAANLPSDFTSRNPIDCPDHSCQICKFVHQSEECVVKSLSVKDVLQGSARMPFNSRSAWYSSQLECPDLRRAHAHLQQGTRPQKKATGYKMTKRYLNIASIANDGLLVYKEDHPFDKVKERIVIPNTILHGFLTSLHLKFDHPSQHQLKTAFNRYFFALDLDKTLGVIVGNCDHCNSLKSFPKEYQAQSSELPPDCVGSSLAADVMRRYKQCILVLRETVSSFTHTMIIENEKSDTVRDALLILTSQFRSSDSAKITIRVDPAPAFQSLEKDTILNQHGIEVVLGAFKNPNKNPVAEKAIQELGLECLKICPDSHTITPVNLALATSRMNSRIRNSGLSASEIWTQRDMLTGEQLPISDSDIIQQKQSCRSKNHVPSAMSKSHGKFGHSYDIGVGDLIYLKSDRDKTKCREKYIVVSMNNESCKVRKFTSTQFRARMYDVKLSDCYPVTSNVLKSSGIIRGLDQSSDSESSDSYSESEEELERPAPPRPPDRIVGVDNEHAPLQPEPPAEIVQLPMQRNNEDTEDTNDLPERRSTRQRKPNQLYTGDYWVT